LLLSSCRSSKPCPAYNSVHSYIEQPVSDAQQG
jgi:hypothetical protein